jgi:hypothetical protein
VHGGFCSVVGWVGADAIDFGTAPKFFHGFSGTSQRMDNSVTRAFHLDAHTHMRSLCDIVLDVVDQC